MLLIALALTETANMRGNLMEQLYSNLTSILLCSLVKAGIQGTWFVPILRSNLISDVADNVNSEEYSHLPPVTSSDQGKL